MCPPKVPKPPKPPTPPSPQAADAAAEDVRRRLQARRGYAASIKTSGRGAFDYGQNSQRAGAGGTLGVGP
jgi:hypothetical protein